VAKDTIISLDLGTTKFCIAVLENPYGSDRKIKIVETEAKGMRRGMLADFSEASKALNELIDKAEKELSIDIRKIVVGVAGSHLRGHMTEKTISINGDSIKQSHIEKLSKIVEQSQINEYRELLHNIPFYFQIDSREPIQNPIGFTGSKLTGRFYCIDADKGYLKDIIRLCNATGLEVIQIFSEPFASASVTVDDKLKEYGVAIADIGGGTTDGIVFQGGKPTSVFTINIAGNMMTSDLCVALNLSHETAEAFKHAHTLQSGDPLDYKTTENVHQQTIQISNHQMDAILGARITELAAYIAESVKDFKGCLAGGIVLTGGGSSVGNIDKFLEKRFKIAVKCLRPLMDIQENERLHFKPKHATAIGLINLELCRRQSHNNLQPKLWAKRYINQFVNWIKDLS
jgi:cell division protein FtsA